MSAHLDALHAAGKIVYQVHTCYEGHDCKEAGVDLGQTINAAERRGIWRAFEIADEMVTIENVTVREAIRAEMEKGDE